LNSSRSQTPTVRHGTESSVASQNPSQLIPLREAKELIEDLFSPKPAVYWSDFLITLTIAYGFAAMYIMAAAFSLIQITALLVSGVALFRVGTFIHEIVHMPRGSMVGFRIAWNLICGVPSLMHSLLYSIHLDHHNPRKYGTPADGEYLPLPSAPIRETVLYLAQIPVLPILAVCRFRFCIPACDDGCWNAGPRMERIPTIGALSRQRNVRTSGFRWTYPASCG
jgi:fatty acid desaturase